LSVDRAVPIVFLLVVACSGAEPGRALASSPSTAAHESISKAEGRAVDPSACVDPPIPERRPTTSVDELPALDRCVEPGKIVREERFRGVFAVQDGGPMWFTWFTTLPECSVANCIARELQRKRADSQTSKDSVVHSFDFYLRPGLPPRNVTEHDPVFEMTKATSCPDPFVAKREKPSGRLPPEQIQSIVRANYDKFRRCYESGLGRNPKLRGKVAIRFVIERDGTVSKQAISYNELPDCVVAACVRDGFSGLKFPAPDGGIVTVVYPIMLEPG
jgi:hypothetical protein